MSRNLFLKSDEMKSKNSLLLLRFTATVIDLAIIYCIATLLQILLYKYSVVNFSYIFVTAFILYYIVSYLFLRERTPAKMFVGIKVVKKNGARLTFNSIVLREIVLKGIIGLLIPLFYVEKLFSIWSVLYTAIVFAVVLLLSLIILLIFKGAWWELLSQTRIIQRSPSSKTSLKYSFFVITILIISSISVITYPFIGSRQMMKTSFHPSYPNTKEVMRYTDFIKQNPRNPVDYVFDLFRKYDIVVISERLHPEFTQYELFFKIINDKRFINDVGNIFTECGSISYQDTLTSYLNTTFESEDALNKRTANLQINSVWPLWENTNFFELLKTVNKLNSTLLDTTKINWYFTDLAVNLKNENHKKILGYYANPKRDSIIAAHIIEKYSNVITKQNRQKALVIMNTRHGYGLIDKRFGAAIKNEYDGTTAFLMKNFPGKVANVMMNTISLKYAHLYTPIQNGKWETAFASMNNPGIGFDFAGTPFGNDKFDLGFKNAPALTYKDVFTGFIFYKSLNEHITKMGFPYEFDSLEDTLLKRAAGISSFSVDNLKRKIASYKQNPQAPITTESIGYAESYNLFSVIYVSIVLIICYLISLMFFIIQVRKPVVRTF